MILEEFAVDPSVIEKWSDLNVLLCNFGFHNGAVIPKIPEKWLYILKNKAARELKFSNEDDYSRVIEKIKRIEDRCLINNQRDHSVAMNREKKISWLENVLLQHKILPFYKIICNENNTPSNVLKLSDIDDKCFEKLRAGKYQRYAEQLVANARLLLLASKNIKIIDPFFSPNDGCIKVLKELIQKPELEKGTIREFSINTSSIRNKKKVNIEAEKKEFKKKLRGFIPKKKTIVIKWWDDQKTKEIHPRYLLTERGGIRYDRGFIEPNDREEREFRTDIAMLTVHETDESWFQYEENQEGHFKIVPDYPQLTANFQRKAII